MPTVSPESLIGYSNVQKGDIDSAFAEINSLNSNINSVNHYFTFAKEELENVDTDLQDQIDSLDSKFKFEFQSLTDADVSLTGSISANEAIVDAAINSLTHTDDSLYDKIDSLDAYMSAAVTSLTLVDTAIALDFSQTKTDIQADLLSLNDVDNSFNTDLNNNIASFNGKITSLTTADNSILNKIQLTNGNFNNDIAALVAKDTALALNDANLNVAIVSLTGEYNAYVINNNTRQTGIEQDITNNYGEFITARDSLFRNDSIFHETLDAALISISTDVTSLQSVDERLQIDIDSNYSLFLKTTADFNFVDSTIQDKLDTYINSINVEITDLHTTDDSLFSLINHNYSIFVVDRQNLWDVDSALQLQLDGITTDLGGNVTSLSDMDSILDEKIASNYSIFEVARDLLEAKDDDLQTQLDTMFSTFSAGIASLNDMDTSQNNKLTALETDINNITTDISGRVQAEIDDKVSDALFQSVKASLETADNSIFDSLATKVNAALQADLDDAQNDAIDDKVDLVVYDQKVEELTAMNHTWEQRFRAAEEFIRVMLATYTITNPNTSNTFLFTGALQNINPGTPLMTLDLVEVPNIDNNGIDSTKWGLDLRLSDYGYNTFTGTISAVAGGVTYNLSKSDFDSILRKKILPIPSSRSGNDSWNTSIPLPVIINYKSYSGMNVFPITLNSTLFTTLTTKVRLVRKVASSNTAWGLVLKMSDYEYNNFTGTITADVGGTVYTLVKADFSAATREGTLVINNSRDGSNWNSVTTSFSILYKDTGNNTLDTISFTNLIFSSLPTA
jgi:hypothetical protein